LGSSPGVVMANGSTVIVTVLAKAFKGGESVESVSVMIALAVPVVGVPDNSPSGFNDRPGGSPLPAVKL